MTAIFDAFTAVVAERFGEALLTGALLASVLFTLVVRQHRYVTIFGVLVISVCSTLLASYHNFDSVSLDCDDLKVCTWTERYGLLNPVRTSEIKVNDIESADFIRLERSSVGYGGLAIIQVFRWAAKEFLDVTDWTYQLNCHDGTEPGRVGYTCNAAMDRSPGNLQFLHGQSSNAAFLAAHAVDSAKKINGFLAGKPVANPGGAQGLHVTESCTSALSVVVLLLPLAAFGWYVVAEARRHLAAQKKRN